MNCGIVSSLCHDVQMSQSQFRHGGLFAGLRATKRLQQLEQVIGAVILIEAQQVYEEAQIRTRPIPRGCQQRRALCTDHLSILVDRKVTRVVEAAGDLLIASRICSRHGRLSFYLQKVSHHAVNHVPVAPRNHARCQYRIRLSQHPQWGCLIRRCRLLLKINEA